VSISIHPEAAQDLAAATDFYERMASSLVARKFLAEFERVGELLAANPGFGTPYDLPRRIYPLRVFPYSVIYRPTEQGIRVLILRHQNRKPSHGQSRI
jgi:plasmid stabilization system protein ParE